MDEKERREALAAFLRTRRARLQPAEVGLPARNRRRTPGLWRKEVAELANFSNIPFPDLRVKVYSSLDASASQLEQALSASLQGI